MVLSCVDLLHHPTYTRVVLPHQHKQVFSNKPLGYKGRHDFYMGEPLPVGTNFVLALDYEHTAVAENPGRFRSGIVVEFQHGFMVLG